MMEEGGSLVNTWWVEVVGVAVAVAVVGGGGGGGGGGGYGSCARCGVGCCGGYNGCVGVVDGMVDHHWW